MSALNRNEKMNCEDCAQEYRRADAARHRKRCEKQKEHKCPNCHFYTKNKEEMGYHVAKKHAQPSSKHSTDCPSCEQEFPSYYSLQQHQRKEHGAKQRKPSNTVADLNKIVEEEGENGEKLKEELSACQHFLVDTEMDNGRHKLFNFQMYKNIQEEKGVCHSQEVQCEQATLHSDSTLHCKGERSLEASCLCQLYFERIQRTCPSLGRFYVC